MAKHQLIHYIRKAQGQGLTNEQIVQLLTEAGWKVHEILDIVLENTRDIPTEETQSQADNIISVRQVSKSYGKIKALDNASLDVKRGSVTALLGPNGAGKTTLVKILTTLLVPDAGAVRVGGLDVVRDAQALRSIIGLAGQFAAVDETLTGRENLEMVGRLYHLSSAIAKSRAEELLHRFDLDESANRPVKTYSGGMRKRLDLGASLVIKPKILFLDEPTTGLDPRGRFTLWQVIRDLVEGDTTVLLTTQYLEEADQLAHKIFVVDHGHIIARGTPDELKRQVGGEVLELHMMNHRDAEQAANVIKSFGREEPHADLQSGIVTMPVQGGTSILVNVIRQLDEAGLKINDVILRRPSLDDVFMKLTGHGAETID